MRLDQNSPQSFSMNKESYKTSQSTSKYLLRDFYRLMKHILYLKKKISDLVFFSQF